LNIQRSFAQEQGHPSTGKGTLYIVGTPIGNLEDMTFRAIRVLREADWIAAEDTRQTRKLLTHYDIQGRLVSYHEHNKQASGSELIAKLLAGQSVALVSDAGMPAISDPGEDLVRLAIDQAIPVVPVPGPSASISALVISGLPTAQFRFAGFLPREKKKCKQVLQELANEKATLIVYEAPHRVKSTISMMLEVWGDRRLALIRELTKRYEEAARGMLSELLAHLEDYPPKGEYCLVVEGATVSAVSEATTWWSSLSIAEHVQHYELQGVPRKEALKKAAVDRGVPKREIYNQLI